MKNFLLLLFTLFTILTGSAQTKLFTILPGTAKEAKQATLLKLDKDQLKAVMDAKAETMELQIPFNGSVITVALEKNNPLREDFHLDTDRGTHVDFTPGLYYRGKNGSFNFFDGEMNGIVSIPNVGNIVVGPYNGNYIVYNDASLNILNDFECKFEDPDPSKVVVSSAKTTTVAKCVSVYLEVDNQLFVSKGSLTATTNFVTSMFNNVQTLFANAGVTISLKSMYVWTSADPYTGTTASAQLGNFHNIRPSFDGDVGQLIAVDSGMKGGVADAIMGVCSPSKYSYVDIDPGFNVTPTYSWSVQGMTHEFGHLLGSPHTHACAWNSNNTPLDGCGSSMGYAEGSCAQGPIPVGVGGTIMSYCHIVSGVGVNFANGFGTQPAARIVSTVSGASCLSADCSGTTTPVCVNGVSTINITSTTTSSLAFTWTDTSTATSWKVGVFTMTGVGTYSTVTSKSFSKTGLLANTFYKIRIMPVCSSGQTVTYKEFIAPTAVSGCTSTITDSGGLALPYTAGESYTRVFTPSTGNKIKLTFSVFNLESGADYFYVYNGSGTTSLIGTYTGTTLPAAITSTASNGVLTIKFISNKTIHNAGFVATVTCVAATATPSTSCTDSTTWNGSSWSNGVPGQTKSAIINGNYAAGSFTCCNLTINSGKTVTVYAGSSITVVNNITINGNLQVRDKGQLINIRQRCKYRNGYVFKNDRIAACQRLCVLVFTNGQYNVRNRSLRMVQSLHVHHTEFHRHKNHQRARCHNRART